MKITHIFKNVNCKISITDDNILIIALIKFIDSNQMNLIMGTLREEIIKSQIKKILIDQRELKILPKETQQIIINSFESLDILKLEKVAIISSDNIFTKLSDDVIDKARVKIINESITQTIRFIEEDEAYEWLLND
ncbi:MAG: hypothetical protein MUC49_01665 [Raineya sp.]|jgi:hypothetical protein|nr:hypothetical protein [Raineya sp.]